MYKFICLTILSLPLLIPGISYSGDWLHRLGGGVEDTVIKKMIPQSSIIKSQHSFKKGKKQGVVRTYKVTSDGSTIVSLETREGAAIEVDSPSGTRVPLDELLIVEESTEKYLKFML